MLNGGFLRIVTKYENNLLQTVMNFVVRNCVWFTDYFTSNHFLEISWTSEIREHPHIVSDLINRKQGGKNI